MISRLYVVDRRPCLAMILPAGRSHAFLIPRTLTVTDVTENVESDEKFHLPNPARGTAAPVGRKQRTLLPRFVMNPASFAPARTWPSTFRPFSGSLTGFAQFLAELGPDSIAGITCSGKTDGMGSQVQGILSVMAFARFLGLPYLHTPFEKIGHAEGETWTTECERFFGIGEGEFQAARADADAIRMNPKDLDESMAALTRWREANNGRRALLQFNNCHFFAESVPNQLVHLRRLFRDKVGTLSGESSGGEFRIAIHVRRGDVVQRTEDGIEPLKKHQNRFATDEHVESIIKACQRRFPDGVVEIVSEGSPADFQRFSDLGCRICLDTEALVSLRRLATADLLVTGKSSFSYIAAMLNRGRVVYEPFWHKPLHDWVWVEDLLAELPLCDGWDSPGRRAVHSRGTRAKGVEKGSSSEYLSFGIPNGQYGVELCVDGSACPCLVSANGRKMTGVDRLDQELLCFADTVAVDDNVLSLCFYSEVSGDWTVNSIECTPAYQHSCL